MQVGSRYRANHPEAVADAAVAGLGIALLPPDRARFAHNLALLRFLRARLRDPPHPGR